MIFSMKVLIRKYLHGEGPAEAELAHLDLVIGIVEVRIALHPLIPEINI